MAKSRKSETVVNSSATRRAFARIARRLKDSSVARVNVKYMVEGPQVSFVFAPYTRGGKIVSAASVPNGLAIEAECLHRFMGLLSQRYPRWWAGAGGFGVFEWDVVSNKLNQFHHARIVNVKTTRKEGF